METQREVDGSVEDVQVGDRPICKYDRLAQKMFNKPYWKLDALERIDVFDCMKQQNE
jgi:hypothetical protein